MKDLDRAFKAFFEKRARFPRFKTRKKDQPRFRIPQRVKVEDSKVYVPKVGWVRIRQSQPIDCPIKGATFKRDADGHWYVSLTAEFEMPDVPLPPANPERVVGIDLGLRHFAVLSDGTPPIDPPQFYRKGLAKLRRAQRALSRKQKGSKNREKARKRLAKLHRKIANQRRDFHHKVARKLVNRYGTIVHEDLNVQALSRSYVAKGIHDAGWAQFLAILAYKAEEAGRRVIKVDPKYTSQDCPVCGHREKKPLWVRVYTCPQCGTLLHRDVAAAQNILAKAWTGPSGAIPRSPGL